MQDRRTFTVVLSADNDGGFIVRVPALPEIVTWGANESDALAMAGDAIQLVLNDMAILGEILPSSEPELVREVTITLAA